MDVVDAPSTDPRDADPKQLLADDVERLRAQREDLDRQIAADREQLGVIRAAIDTAVNAVWRDVFGQQQRIRDRENITDALLMGWLRGYQLVAAACFVIVAGLAIYALQAVGLVFAVALYFVLGLVGYLVARDQCLGPIKKARASYLNRDGKDVRFVAFSRYEPGLNHPLIGYDGPTDGMLEDRSWKIPGVRDKEALGETFVEVIDERRSNVLLTRFPDKKPTLVHADLENPFIRAYGVFFQRALERHIGTLATQAAEFREIVQHAGARKELDDRLRRMEEELREFDGTAAMVKGLALPVTVRNKLIHQVVLFRLGDPAMRRGLFLLGGERVDLTDVMQTLARASAATLLQLSFAQIKIGYVGQGAATVSRLFATAKRARSIVFIDEAERFFSTSGSALYESMRKEVVQALISEWDQLEGRTNVWVVAGARSREDLDQGIVARFGTLIDMGPVSFSDEPATMVIEPVPESEPLPESAGWADLPEPVLKRTRLLSAMFAHFATMGSQGITVPRAVLIGGSTTEARERVMTSLADQTGLPVLPAFIDDLDVALGNARASGHALLAVEIPEYGDPGSIAHLAITIDMLAENKEPIFIVGMTADPGALDPELRSRFPEFVDLTELTPPERRAKLNELLAGKPLTFDLESAMEELEAQTDGMTVDQLRQFVDEAGRHAALRAIDAGAPDHVLIDREDFARRTGGPSDGTKADEAAL
ncbi:MAG TPA: AAA family ATPase [Candidatus Lustribacter sp.]